MLRWFDKAFPGQPHECGIPYFIQLYCGTRRDRSVIAESDKHICTLWWQSREEYGRWWGQKSSATSLYNRGTDKYLSECAHQKFVEVYTILVTMAAGSSCILRGRPLMIWGAEEIEKKNFGGPSHPQNLMGIHCWPVPGRITWHWWVATGLQSCSPCPWLIFPGNGTLWITLEIYFD